MIKILRNLFNIKIPLALTEAEWDLFYSDLRKNNFIGYFLTETIPDFWYDIISPISNLYYKIRCRIRKYYLIDTKLNRYQYYDIDTRMLWANFSLLTEFVDIELSNMYSISYDKTYTGSKGLAYCMEIVDNWDLGEHTRTLFDEDYVNKEKVLYKEILDLYIWWNHTRPIRIDPYDQHDGTIENTKKCFNIEKEYNAEDQDMLIRLIKIRERLWT